MVETSKLFLLVVLNDSNKADLRFWTTTCSPFNEVRCEIKCSSVKGKIASRSYYEIKKARTLVLAFENQVNLNSTLIAIWVGFQLLHS